MKINFKENVEEILRRLKIDRATAVSKADMTLHQFRMLLGYGAPIASTVNRLAKAWDVAPSEFILGPSKNIKEFENPLNVAKRVKSILRRKRLSVKDLVKLMKWDGRGNAHHFFKTNNPRIMRLPEMARVLEVELMELVK